tara:strand:- start:115 stop:732 length:618 start_codon:yes stop_codon:yes gene_type:complete
MKIICIGRNYALHAKELGNELPAEPLFFLKPDSAILTRKHAFYMPEWTDDVQHEVELVIKIRKLGKGIQKKFAPRYYSMVGLGIDFTARDVQSDLKEKGHPWEKSKCFDGSAVVSHEFISLRDLGGDIQNLNFELKKNGEVIQSGNSADMIFSVDDLIVYLSKFMTLKTGDLIFTGTPAGVGQVKKGDLLTGALEGNHMFDVRVR